jgi:hypothetical protein
MPPASSGSAPHGAVQDILSQVDPSLCPDVRERICHTAVEWVVRYREGPGRFDEGDCVAPLVLLARICHGSQTARCAWERFKCLVAAEVKDASKDPESKYLDEFSRSRLDADLKQFLQNTLKDCAGGDSPNPRWLKHAYRFAFAFFRRQPPAALPEWWEQVVGLGPRAPSNQALPPIQGPPPNAPVLPDEAMLAEFVQEEKQCSEALARVLRSLHKEPTPLLLAGVPITRLQFVYLCYRNSPALVTELTPTPTSQELAEFLNQQGCVNSDGGPLTANNLDQLRRRIRDRGIELIDEAMRSGDLPDLEWRRAGVLPRPNWYTPGHLFPPRRCGDKPRRTPPAAGGEP